MAVADKIILNHSKSVGRDSDRLIMLSYVAFAFVVMVLIYASGSPGTDAAEIVSMSVFP
jgi:hypothetical protein